MRSKRTKGSKGRKGQSSQWKTAAANPQALIVQKALHHHQAGEFDAAEKLYRQALKVRPNYPDALHLLGFLYHSRNQNEEAVSWIEKAVAADSKQPLYYNNLGTVYDTMNRQEEASRCYQKALAIQPDYVGALCNMGNTLKALGKTEEAIQYHQKALAIQPDFYEAHNNLGIVFQESGRQEEAIACYRKTLELKPDYEATYNNLGFALRNTGQFEEALTCYRKALEINPAYIEAYNNMGNAFLSVGKHADAATCYQNALTIKPDYQDALNNMGNLLREQGKLEESIDLYRKALDVAPNLYDAHNNLGNALQRIGKQQESIDCYLRALELNPKGHGAYNNLGFAWQSVGEMEKAVTCYKKALEIKSDNPSTHSTLLHQMQWLCDWESYQERYDRMIEMFHATEKPINPFTFILLPTSAEEQRKCAEIYVQNEYSVQEKLYTSRHYPSHPDRIKIGYLSCDFQDHATSLLMAELFELHDHSRFEIKVYSYGQDDGNEMRRRIIAACDTFTDIYASSHQDAAQRILNDGVHILIEMKGFTNNTRLEIAALQPAPIQAAWLGYPGTEGAPFIDYILTDPFVTPPGSESHFTEKVVRLPGCYQPNDRKRVISDRQFTRQEFGLPEKGFIFASFNKSYKINPELYDVWMRLLQKTPGSVLWLWETNDTTIKNLRREAEVRGVDGTRLFFSGYLPISEHLARYRLVDLAIDTFPCTSHTTGSDALWAGCPIVTCAGETFASRVAGSLIASTNMPELITYSLEAYETLVMELVNDPDRLAAIRQQLQDNLATAPLFDSLRYTRGLEAAYEAMWQRFQEGLTPDHIDVQPLGPGELTEKSQPFSVKITQSKEKKDATIDIHSQDRVIASQVQRALKLHQENQLDEAETIYRQVLDVRPDQDEALHLMGFLFHQRGQQEEAAKWISQAIAINAKQPLYLSNLGIVLAGMGRQKEAITQYRKALEVQPDFYNALCNLGNALLEIGEQEEGIAQYRKALEAQPDLHAGHNNLGNALQGVKRWDEAILSYKKAIEVKPDYVEAYNNMGFAFQAQEKFEEAIACCQKALEIRPNYDAAYSNIGNALLAIGKIEEGIASYYKALELNPNSQEACNNLGNALLGQGKLKEAVIYYRKALEIEPNLYDAYSNLGNALQELDNLDEAIVCYRKALELKPDHSGALNNLGFALLDLGKIDEAIDCYQKALDVDPGDPNKHSAILHQMLHICRWEGFQERYDRMITLFNAVQKNVNPFVFLSLPTTPEEQLKCVELYIKEKVPAPIHGYLSASRHYPPNPDRIKVGYLSGDYQNHPVAFLTAEMFELHDRSRFEIYAYSYGPDDGREMRRRVMAACDHFIDLQPLDYATAAQRIHDDGIHILMELNGFTKGVRLQIPALRPAPIQACWLGYLGTMGAPFIDYIIADAFVAPPGHESYFSEKILRLPECFQPNDRQRTISARTPTRQERGLPEEGFIFASFNKSYKINPKLFAAWMRILKQLPKSLLWLYATNQWVDASLRREAEALGVDSRRIYFVPIMPLEDYLANYRLVDLVLDTHPYNSGTTASNALWAGCPMITYSAKTFVSRQAGSLLINIGLPELVTHSMEGYESLALELARNPERLAAIRKRLQQNLSTAPLFDSVRFTMGMETAYEAMWQRFKSGQAPDHIQVPSVDIQGSNYLDRKASAESVREKEAEASPSVEIVPDAATPPQEPIAPPNPALDISAYPGGAESPLFVSSLIRSVDKTLDALELIDIAAQLNSDPKTINLTSDLYRVWLVHNIDHPLAYAIYFNYGAILSTKGNLEGAKLVLNESIRLNPDFFPSYINLGGVLERMGNPDEGVACWQKVVDRLPGIKSETIGYKLSALKQMGRVSDSPEVKDRVFRQSLEIKPDQFDILQQWINVRRRLCQWPLIQPWANLSAPQLKQGFAPLSLAAYSDDPMWQLANACRYNMYEYTPPEINFMDRHPSLLENRSSHRLKIGYLSSDIREHAVGYLTAEIYELHDREKVEVYIYYVGHEVGGSDHIHQRARTTSDHFFDVAKMTPRELAQKIADDRIDILVDLNGHTLGALPKMLDMRPAPIIVNWLGYPGTMGSAYHNYIIADDFIIPKGSEIYYSEKVLRLPCYQPNDRKRTVSDKPPSRQEEGLPEDSMVYSCLNGVQKLTPDIWNIWMQILQQVPDSVLWLLGESEDIKNRLRELAVQNNVAAERLVFSQRKPNVEHVPRFALSDLGLDSAPYGSHTTASDGLWAGLPILALPGLGFASRVCASLVKSAGLETLICASPEEYVARAIDFGRNRDKLQKYRQILATQRDSSVLFDTPSLVAHLEELYAQMWEDFKQGNLPRPDLSNLNIYQEIGIERDVDGVACATDQAYRASYQERLIQKDRFRFIHSDCRMWPSPS